MLLSSTLSFSSNASTASVTGLLHYYPFGMVEPGRSFSAATSTRYGFGFNGQEKDDDLNSEGNLNTALYWEYDTRLGRRWNQDPKPNVSISNYSCFADNPIWFNDPFGDDLHLDDLYKKDKDGNLLNRDKVEAFELFASTKAGKKFLLSYAQKGFELKGEVIKDLYLKAPEEGLNSKKGIDYTYQIAQPKITGFFKIEYPVKPYTSPFIMPNGRLNIVTNLLHNNQYGDAGKLGALENVDEISHESLLHGDLITRRYLAGEKNRWNLLGPDHTKFFQTSLFFKEGLNILKTVQSSSIIQKYGGANYSDDYLYYNIMAAGAGYLMRDEIKH